MTNNVIDKRCNLCLSDVGFSKTALRNSTWKVNGIHQVLCHNCEVSLFTELLKARIKKKKMIELTERLMSDERDEILELYRT